MPFTVGRKLFMPLSNYIDLGSYGADSDGNLRAESRHVPMVIYVSRVVAIGSPPLTLFSFSHHDDASMVGGYRSGPREMTLEFSKGTVFSGNCEQGI